jgi:tetratricopeptide (TPR) repeat protein
LRLSEALQQATRVHAQGKLVQAERLYRAILTTIPDQFDALHFLGLARAQQKRFDEAAKLLDAAVRSDPRSFEAHNNLGNALQALVTPVASRTWCVDRHGLSQCLGGNEVEACENPSGLAATKYRAASRSRIYVSSCDHQSDPPCCNQAGSIYVHTWP